MTFTREPLSREQLETRRLVAGIEFAKHVRAREITRQFGVGRATTYRWLRLFNERGMCGLMARKASGRPPLLNTEQVAKLREIYARNPVGAFQLSEIIQREFGIRMSHDRAGSYIRKYLNKEKVDAAAN